MIIMIIIIGGEDMCTPSDGYSNLELNQKYEKDSTKTLPKLINWASISIHFYYLVSYFPNNLGTPSRVSQPV